MIRSFRAAIGALGLGTVLVGASALTHQKGLRHPGVRLDGRFETNSLAEADATATPRSLHMSSPIRDDSVREPPENVQSVEIGPLVQGSGETKPGNSRLASMQKTVNSQTSPGITESAAGSINTSAPASEHPAPSSSHAQPAAVTPSGENVQLRLITRVYRPGVVVAKDLERLIRPLLTHDGTVISTALDTLDGQRTELQFPAGPRPQLEVLVVRDLPEIVRQLDAMIVELDTPVRRTPTETPRTAGPILIPRSHVIR